MKTPNSTLLAFSIFMLTSCTHLRTFSTFDDINAVSKDRKGQIILVNGVGYTGRSFHLADDSTHWRDLNTNESQSISTSQIHAIAIKKSSRGAWEGFGLGLLAGAVSGVVIGLMSGDESASGVLELGILRIGPFPSSEGGNALGYGIVFGGLGGLVGLPIGAATGSKDKFVLQ